MSVRLSIILLYCGFFWSCSSPNPQIKTPDHIAPGEIEEFSIDNTKDTTLYTSDEIIIHIDAGSVINNEGQPVDQYTMGLAGFMDASEALVSGLTTSTRDGLLNSSAMLYTSINKDGNALYIDPEKPINIEIPDYYNNESIQVYQPENPESEEIIWKKTQTPTYLTTLDFDLLDFLPEGFSDTALTLMGKGLSPEAIDSIYYAMESYERIWIEEELDYRPRNYIYVVNKTYGDTLTRDYAAPGTLSPAVIKVLKSPKLKNTFVATKAFEQRLKTLHQLDCYDEPIETYLKHLHEPLWVSDSIIFHHQKFDDPALYDFEKFYQLKQTNTRDAPESSNELFDWFLKEVAKERKQIERVQKKVEQKKIKPLKQVLKQREKLMKKKTKLLKKREAYRMKRFEFEMTETGWYNFAIPAKVEDLERFEMDVTIENGQDFLRTYTYVVNPKIFSLYAMKSENNRLFNKSHSDDPHLLMWKNQEANIIGIGYEKGNYAYKNSNTQIKSVNHLSLTLEQLSFNELKQNLRQLPLKKRENKITADLYLGEQLARQDSLLLIEIEQMQVRQSAIGKLFKVAFPCYYRIERADN